MKAERVELMDALRGFSLIGILIANMLHFQFGASTVEIIESANVLDQVSYYLVKIIVEGSVYPIFGFVFGYVLLKMVESREALGLKYKNIVFRRAVGLSVLGVMHLMLLWQGDILFTYGSTLFILLLFFLKRQVKTYFVWGAINAVIALVILISTNILQLAKPLTAAQIMTYQNGTYGEILTQRLNEFMGVDSLATLFILPIILLVIGIFSSLAVSPFVLFGMGMAKKGAFSQLDNGVRTYKKVALLVPVGLLLKVAIIFDTPFSLFIYTVGQFVLAIGYIALFAWLFTRYQTQMKKYFEPIGKLSLTNYLMQTIICTTIFYGYGFGMFGKLGVFIGILLAIIIYVIQLKMSQLYLKRFSIGPVEMILRWFIYFKNPRKVE